MLEREQKVKVAKDLIKSGKVISGVGAFTVFEAIATSHGELGPVGLLIGATGVTIFLAGKRQNKE